MSETAKLATLQVENFMRIRAAFVEFTPDGLTVIGGKNGEGKTSFLRAVAYLFGGAKYEPTNAKRDGAATSPLLKATLANGLIIERSGNNGALKVTDPKGNKYGQSLLDAFKTQIAIDLPRFNDADSKKKAGILLQCLGVGDKLAKLEAEEKKIYADREAQGRIADSLEKHAKTLPEYLNAPKKTISASEIIAAQQGILTRNAERRRDRENWAALEAKANATGERLADLKKRLAEAETEHAAALSAAINGGKSAITPEESTAELEAQLADIEAVNAQVSANAQKKTATESAAKERASYVALTTKLEAARAAKKALLDDADLPLPGLSVEDGSLLYNGKAWDCMSSADQLRVGVAIAKRFSPECGFVLVDKLEQMDLDTMREFGAWLTSQGLQALATRVSTGDECSLIIEDGMIVGDEPEIIF